MLSRSRQRAITGGIVILAFLALVLGAMYQDDTPIDDATIVGLGTTQSPTPTAPGQSGTTGALPGAATIEPVEHFLPRSGQASACREPVGVDLAPGYAATLTINGISIAPEEMNVVLDEEGGVTNVLTASRSLGQYTFGPEPECPNGRVLRATDNLLQACVYRIEEGPAACVIKQHRFNVL